MPDKTSLWAGDILLLFNASAILPARSGAAWVPVFRQPGVSLYLSNATKDWRDSPISEWQEGSHHFWLIGEIWGERTELNPADWTGHFALLALDAETNHWHLWTNRCGTFHVYHGSGGGASALGTYSPSVAATTAKTLDVEGLAGFFSFGFFPGEHTYHKEVSIIRPATHLVLDGTGQVVKQERTWQWQHRPTPGLTFDQAVDQFAEIFHQVISEQVNGRRVAFPISGGLDSRSTIAALPSDRETNKPWCFSYGYAADSPENRIAEKVANAHRLPYQSFVIHPYLFESLSKVIESVEGFQDITQCRQASMVNDISAHADYVMAAHWGDVWLDDMGVGAHPELELAEFATNKFRKHSDWLIKHIIEPLDPNLDVSTYLHDTLKSELQPLNSIEDPDFKIKALKTELWSFRWTMASIRMYQPGSFPLLPFYDPRLVDFICTVPTEFVKDRKLQVEYLKRYAPDLARIPWQVYDANLYWYRYFNSLLLPKRALKKTLRKLSRKPVIQRNWEVQFLSPGGRENLESHLLSDGLKILELTPRKEIENLLERFYASPTPADGYTVSMLLTFAAWLERYG